MICTPGTAVTVAGTGAPARAALLLRFGQRTVGGGVSDPAGVYRLTLQMGQERPGDYPITVEVRESRAVVHRSSCTVPGARPSPSPASATPRPGVSITPTVSASPTSGPSPTPPTVTRPVENFDSNGDERVTCADFATQAEAQEALDAGYINLDEDRDGIPCETLPQT